MDKGVLPVPQQRTVTWLTVDLEGTPRPQGSGYDIGAFEERWKVYLPLILKGY